MRLRRKIGTGGKTEARKGTMETEIAVKIVQAKKITIDKIEKKIGTGIEIEIGVEIGIVIGTEKEIEIIATVEIETEVVAEIKVRIAMLIVTLLEIVTVTGVEIENVIEIETEKKAKIVCVVVAVTKNEIKIKAKNGILNATEGRVTKNLLIHPKIKKELARRPRKT